MKKEKKNDKEEKSGEKLLSPETKNSILAVIFFLAAGLLALSLMGRAGVAGKWIEKGVDILFGKARWVVLLLLGITGISFLAKVGQAHWKRILPGTFLVLISILGVIELLGSIPKEGGWIGYFAAMPIISFLSPAAGMFLFAAMVLVGVLLMFDISLRTLALPFKRAFYAQRETGTGQDITQEEWQTSEIQTIKENKTGSVSIIDGKQRDKEEVEEKETHESRQDSEYAPPPLSLLEPDGAGPSSGDIQANKNIIQRTFEEFAIEVEMGEVSVGPTVTQYTLKPAQGVNLSRITALSRNLSLSLAAHPIRIEAPIPGKGLVGIEIPNKQAAVVRLRSLLASLTQKRMPSTLMLALGRDVAGEPVLTALDKMPHLLVSGSTGAGKSICLNGIITSLIYFNSPRKLRFLLIDPKRVEFSIYEGIPHLLAPVIVDTKKAIGALKWIIAEMERRYELLEGVNVRDIKGYNNAVKKREDTKPLSYIVVIIDEMADLMMKYKREVEASIVRIAQMARAVGIHLITSTQRPSTDVVTGLIKANITARIAFKMPTQIDSRTILDQAGAERLLGYGDMLFMNSQAHGLKRIQGTYISDKEVKKAVEYLRKLPLENNYEDIAGPMEEGKGLVIGSGLDMEDDLYDEARSIAMESGKISASLLQRKLQIGYARAARLLDIMESEGIIGPGQGAKPREVIK